jgi:hypothetical protein
MTQSYRRANRKAWFSVNNELKQMGDKPKVPTKKKSLLQKPDDDVYGTNMTPTAEYVLAIREAIKSGKET